MSCYMCTVLVYSYCTACTELFSCTDVTSDRALTSFVKGSYRNHFSPPRACALRNGRGARSHSRACSSAIATLTMSLTVACASSVRMPLSRSHLRISKVASVSVPPDSSSGGSDYILRSIGAADRWVHQDLGSALPTRIAVGRSMFRGRYRPFFYLTGLLSPRVPRSARSYPLPPSPPPSP